MPGPIIQGATAAATMAITAVLLGNPITFAALAVTFAVTAGLSFAAQALQPSPRMPELPDFSAEMRGRMVVTRSSDPVREIVYGETTKAGPLLFWDSSGPGNRYLHLVIALADHGIESAGPFFFDDEEVGERDGDGNVTTGRFAGKARIRVGTGAADQLADPFLVSEVAAVEDTDRWQGIAYLYVRLEHDADTFAGRVPGIRARVRGKSDIHDPRDGSTRWTDNWALCLRDYALLTRGLNADADELDEDSFIAAANASDEEVLLAAGGTQKRYTLNGVVGLDATPDRVVAEMELAGAGHLFYQQGRLRLFAGVAAVPVATVTGDHLRDAIQVVPRPERQRLFNTVVGRFADRARNHNTTDFPAQSVAAYVAEDGGEAIERDLELRFVDDVARAQRLAFLLLNRSRLGVSVDFPAKPSLTALSVLDVVALDFPELGFDGLTVRVTERVRHPDGSLDFTFQREDAAVYDWSSEQEVTPALAPPSALPSPFVVPAPGLAVSEALVTTASGIPTTEIVITLTAAADAFLDVFEVEYRKAEAAGFTALGSGSEREWRIANASDGQSYTIRARARNVVGARSPWTEKTIDVVGRLAPLDPVTGLNVTILDGTAFLTWDALDDIRLSHYRIKHHDGLTGATWGGSVDLVPRVAKPATSVAVPALVGTYLVKGITFKGIESTAAALAVTSIAGITAMNAVAEIVAQPDWEGLREDVEVHGEALRLAGTQVLADWPVLAGAGSLTLGAGGQFAPEGCLTLAETIDLQAVFVSRVTARLQVVGENIANVMAGWASLAGAGPLSGTDPSQYDVRLEMRTSTDDPAAAPTWSAWKPLMVGDHVARAFQFRARLASFAPTVTPRITMLEAGIDMPDRVLGDHDVPAGTGGTAIVFDSPFFVIPAIGITGDDMLTGDTWRVTGRSPAGFTITFYDAGGTPVARQFDWIARAYGKAAI